MNIGVIGGADGPTSIFLSGNTDYLVVIAGIIIIGIIVLYIRKRKKRS